MASRSQELPALIEGLHCVRWPSSMADPHYTSVSLVATLGYRA